MKHATNSVYKSYFHALYLSRLAFFGFWICFGYFVMWSIPWFGIGLSREDYTPQYIMTMSFAAGSMALGLLYMTLRTMARHKREALVAWNSLYDESTGTHTRSHLYDRLSLECERSERHGSSFALILLKLRPPDPGRGRHGAIKTTKFLRRAADLVQSLTRPSDLVALVSNSEFAVLACGVDAEGVAVLTRRLRASLAVGLPGLARDCGDSAEPLVELGVAMYGRDGTTPETLVDAARAAAQDRGTLPLSDSRVA
ncbi:MAG: diguanylate cyclase [Dehalococcoidia bacterium]